MLQGEFCRMLLSPGPEQPSQGASHAHRETAIIKAALLPQTLVGSHRPFSIRSQACLGQQHNDLLLVLCWKVLTVSSACRSASDSVTSFFSGSDVLLAPHEPSRLPAALSLRSAPCQPVISPWSRTFCSERIFKI